MTIDKTFQCPKCGSKPADNDFLINYLGQGRVDQDETEGKGDPTDIVDIEETSRTLTDISWVQCMECDWTGTLRELRGELAWEPLFTLQGDGRIVLRAMGRINEATGKPDAWSMGFPVLHVSSHVDGSEAMAGGLEAVVNALNQWAWDADVNGCRTDPRR